jgi:hypothetical protein
LVKWFEKLFHKHDYVKVGFRQEEDGDVRYSVRKYQCHTCEKIKWVDGRFDNN